MHKSHERPPEKSEEARKVAQGVLVSSTQQNEYVLLSASLFLRRVRGKYFENRKYGCSAYTCVVTLSSGGGGASAETAGTRSSYCKTIHRTAAAAAQSITL